MTDLPNSKISDEEMDELVKLFRAGHAAVPARATPDERVRAGLAVALVASGWRPEAAQDRDRLYGKFRVERTDGRDKADARYFVLDYVHDRHARTALTAYADACEAEKPGLAASLRAQLREAEAAEPVGALPVADGSEGEHVQERSEEQRHG